MGTIRFSLPADKVDKTGMGRIDLIYSLHKQRKFYRVPATGANGVKLFPINWNQETQEAIYLDKKAAKKAHDALYIEKPLPAIDYALLLTAAEADEINTTLNSLKKDIKNIETRFELDGVVYSSEMVIDRLNENKPGTTKKENPSKYVYDFIDQYIENNKATRVKGSLVVYSSLKSHLQNFEKHAGEKISFERIDHNFFGKFQGYLLAEGGVRISKKGKPYAKRGLTNITVAKQLSTLRTFLGYAKASGITVSDKYKLFKIKKEDGAVIALTEEEFKALLKLDLPKGSTQDHVRDAFCFACSTGLRYSDLSQLAWHHIKDDEIVINIIKKKKPVPHTIPLTPFSIAILKKYKGKIKPLHVISNARMNEYLKGNEKKKIDSICQLAGITDPTVTVHQRGAVTETEVVPKYKLIGVHNGRKTFVTLCLERGMTAEEVMPVSGHESYASFKRYVNITDQRKKKAMAKAWGMFSSDKLKAV
jgi:integrase